MEKTKEEIYKWLKDTSITSICAEFVMGFLIAKGYYSASTLVDALIISEEGGYSAHDFMNWYDPNFCFSKEQSL